jgi:hypothetical protein
MGEQLREQERRQPAEFPLHTEESASRPAGERKQSPFGDICVHENCNNTYANDTAFEDFLTGAEEFTVKEIEVFEIAD